MRPALRRPAHGRGPPGSAGGPAAAGGSAGSTSRSRRRGGAPAPPRNPPADRASGGAPGTERAEQIAEQDAEEREAEPGGDEDEGEGVGAVRRLGPAQAGVDGATEQQDPDHPVERLGRPPEEDPREALPAQRAPGVPLEARLAPADRERVEGADEDDRRPPGEKPGRDRQVLPGDQRMRKRQEVEVRHGFTRSSMICSLRASSSASKIPSRLAGKSKLTVPPGFMSFIRS